MRYCLSQRQASAETISQLGGKAFNLAFLHRHGALVPDFWVLPVAAFEHQCAPLIDWIDEQLKPLTAESDSNDIQVVAERIQQAILASELNQDIASALDAVHGIDEGYWAARSSVVGEDGHDASFAGQMDSCLYLTGRAALAGGILTVMQSAFNARALAYRLQKGIGLQQVRVAVIIQRMINADSAGVMFTANPVNGNRRQTLISATWGCGEGLVSGICNSDEFVLNELGDVTEQTLGDKDLELVLDTASGQGTAERAVEDARRQQPCLSITQLQQLREEGQAIARWYGKPQDIEWCYSEGRLWILQARPVTALPRTAQTTDCLKVWDNSNIQESYCGVTTPLTFSFANQAYKTVYEQTLRILGVREQVISEHQDMLNNMLGLIHGRVYYNINNWYRGLLFLPSFKANKADMERMMGLEDPVDFIQPPELSTGDKLRRLPQMIRAFSRLLSAFRVMESKATEFRTEFSRVYASVPRSTLHTLSLSELVQLTRYLDEQLLKNWTTPILNDFYVMMMNGKVHRQLSGLGIEHIETVQNQLLSGEEGIESTEPTKWILALCDDLRRMPELQDVILSLPAEQLHAWLQVNEPAIYERCLEYIERYGDRVMGELKLESISLRQDPAFFYQVLKNFLGRDDLTLATLSANEARYRAEAEQQVFSRLRGGLAKRRFIRDLARLREAIRNRENMRLARTRMFGLYRDIYREMGQQLAFSGQLAEAEDIFYLTREEIEAAHDGRSVTTNIAGLVALRREEFAGWHAAETPHHFYTWGMVSENRYEYPHAQEELADNSPTLKGTGCYPGIVEQPVRLIFSPQDELSLDGQILCTVRTDPGWAPLFPTAGGILVERGSTLSHSAVVARELGIPAIVGIPGLTRMLNNQEIVRMDGSSGVITRLSLPLDDSAAQAPVECSDVV
ncbi:phosphoenolpyruvate synthase [Thalassolituus marinus]|uniref:Phosphoenolpyruvate synthase n=1 Tax=Thalassolituus marinus TaxID=671053 RepID=A0ABS7ZNT4_9GAMM|nr:phosphoenolpyruvate synthase [Thalassolituus marinus]MCA6063366.1 phosphoenolpyruvate synthase [Thalassolituus marinus]